MLVIDDEPNIVPILRELLSDEGYAVRTAEDGREGLQHAREWRPDVILCDLVMPRMNGFAFVNEYRALALPDAAALIIMSAAGPAVTVAANQLRPDDVVAKPFDADHILQVVGHHVRQNRLRAG